MAPHHTWCKSQIPFSDLQCSKLCAPPRSPSPLWTHIVILSTLLTQLQPCRYPQCSLNMPCHQRLGASSFPVPLPRMVLPQTVTGPILSLLLRLYSKPRSQRCYPWPSCLSSFGLLPRISIPRFLLFVFLFFLFLLNTCHFENTLHLHIASHLLSGTVTWKLHEAKMVWFLFFSSLPHHKYTCLENCLAESPPEVKYW